MLTAARLREDVRPAGLDWITALRAPQVKALVRDGALQLSLFDQMDLAEITSPDFPGERLVACKNPFLEAERARKRESLLAATEADLAKIAAAVQRDRRPLRGQDAIAVRADRVLRRRKVAKHFTTDIGDDHFSYARNQDSITAEAALDGIYVLRTSVSASGLGQRRGGRLLQGARPGRAGVPRLQHRPGHPPDPPPHRDPGPGARVLADAVVLHHLAHARPPRAAAVHRRRQASRPRRPHQPRRPRRPLPAGPGQGRGQAHRRRPAGAQLRTACSPTWPPSASTRSSPPTPPCPPSSSSPPPPRCSARPSTCSASATASASRSQKPPQHHPETPGKRPYTRITGGNFG